MLQCLDHLMQLCLSDTFSVFRGFYSKPAGEFSEGVSEQQEQTTTHYWYVTTNPCMFSGVCLYWNNLSFYLHPGLGSIIECVKAGTNKGEALYLCKVCACRVSKADIRNHIMGSLHRYNYIVSRTVKDVVMASSSAALIQFLNRWSVLLDRKSGTPT